MYPRATPRRQRRFLGASLLAFALLVFTSLVLTSFAGGFPWIDVFVATFDRATSDPATWAEVGNVSTVPSRWGRAAGDSGPVSSQLLLTSDDGDPSVDVGINGTFTAAANAGVLVCTFDVEAKQESSMFKATLGIDKGADIVGVTIGDDGMISVPGRPEKFWYDDHRPYHVALVVTWLGPSIAKADVTVVDKTNLLTIAAWSFVLDQQVTGINRMSLLRKGGTPGSFTIDSINASWMVSNPGH